MSLCGQCGISGHNKRTCQAPTIKPSETPVALESAPITSRSKAPCCETCARLLNKTVDKDDLGQWESECKACRSGAPRSSLIGEIDAGTIEAIEWYLAMKYPDWPPMKLRRGGQKSS